MLGLSRLFRTRSRKSPRRPISSRLGLEQLGFGSPAAASPRIRHSFRPELEPLEERRVMSASGTISAITDAMGRHTDYWVGAGNHVFIRQNGVTTDLGGFAKQVSAGLDANGKAEVWFIGRADSGLQGDRLCLFDQNGNRKEFDSTVTGLSATEHHECYVVDTGRSVWVNGGEGGFGTPQGFHFVGGTIAQGTTISAGTDGFLAGARGRDRDFVYAIGTDQKVYVNFSNLSSSGGTVRVHEWWLVSRGLELVTQISGGENHKVYGRLTDGRVAAYDLRLTWGGPADRETPSFTSVGVQDLGGNVVKISAGQDHQGNDQVFAIDTNSSLHVNNGSGWVSRGFNAAVNVAGDRGDHVVAVHQTWNWGTKFYVDDQDPVVTGGTRSWNFFVGETFAS